MPFDDKPSREDFLIPRSFFPFTYIGESHCHSKDDRNELSKYLRAMVARERNISGQIHGRSSIILRKRLKSLFARDYDEFPGLRTRFTY